MASKPSKFWADASRKTGTWAAVAAVAAPLFDHLDEGTDWASNGWKHVLVVAAVAALRAVLALAQGNVGDREKASFAPAVPAPEAADPVE